MPKLTLEDLKKIKENYTASTTLREGGYRAKITVHMGTCGIASGARKIMSVFLKQIEDRKADDIIITTSGCAGLCSREPMATVELLKEAPVKYCDLTEEKAQLIFEQHILGGKIVEQYALAVGHETSF
jgi:NADP-reducing hydrogenase subunit HndB